MVVSYFLQGKEEEEVCGSGKTVTIPGNATRLEVKFQVRRPFYTSRNMIVSKGVGVSPISLVSSSSTLFHQVARLSSVKAYGMRPL